MSNGIVLLGDAVDAKSLVGAQSRTTNKRLFATYTKRLFKYLVNEQITKYNYSGIIPKIQYWETHTVGLQRWRDCGNIG